MRGASLLFFGAFLLGCDEGADQPAGQDGSDYSDQMPEDLPAGGCWDDDCEEGGSSGGVDATPAAPEEAGCQSTNDCSGAGACVAAFEDGRRGGFACRFVCVPTLDEASWCGDDDSCCDPDAVCTDRGYCVTVPAPTRAGSGEVEGHGPRLSDEMPEDLPAGDGVPDQISAPR